MEQPQLFVQHQTFSRLLVGFLKCKFLEFSPIKKHHYWLNIWSLLVLVAAVVQVAVAVLVVY